MKKVLFLLVIVILLGAGAVFAETEFRNPERIYISKLPIGFGGTEISTEEPFVSRDGKFLFFNTADSENKKDLHYAREVNGRWVYHGEIGPFVNTIMHVEGNPSMDQNNNFYYVDTSVKRMIKKSVFDPGTGEISNQEEFKAAPKRKVKIFAQKLHGNMGVEISADGSFVFFSRAVFKMKGFGVVGVRASDIIYARRSGGKFVYKALYSKRIMKNINTSDWEYAASVSTDGLELFFTRLFVKDIKGRKIRSQIMRSTRRSVEEPFGVPEIVKAIGQDDFVEGPAISGDGNDLYYHKKDGDKFRLYKVTKRR